MTSEDVLVKAHARLGNDFIEVDMLPDGRLRFNCRNFTNWECTTAELREKLSMMEKLLNGKP